MQLLGNARVVSLQSEGGEGVGGQFRVSTERGSTLANEVIIATNGYSDNLFPYTRRRIIPIGSYMIATEAISPTTISRLIPGNRIVTDSRQLVVYYRPCPEGRRIIFGARVSIAETDPLKTVPAMHKQLTLRFPELETVKISHSWMGFVAYTFDDMPHFGQQDGIHYAMGYCGSGVSLSSYSGVQIARQLLSLIHI